MNTAVPNKLYSQLSLRPRRAVVVGVLLGFLVTALTPRFTQAVDSIQTVDAAGDVGDGSSLVLDSQGNPVIAYFDGTIGTLKLAHCNDPNCAGNDESIMVVALTGQSDSFPSLVLDSAGNPVISYYQPFDGDLKVAHCNDPNCAGNNESIVAIDTVGDVGLFSSLMLDSAGNPVISYYDGANGDLKLVHCNDPNCAGNNESIVAVDTAGNVGLDTSLALDSQGFPVVSYFDFTNGALKLVHCNDANCAGNNESIVTVDGGSGSSNSLALDSVGNPVISYYDGANVDLKVAHCNDPNCVGNNESIIAVDTTGDVGKSSSLALDSAGHPVISYLDSTNNAIKVAHCNDPNCAGNNESIEVVDTNHVDFHSSFTLDSQGHPVLSYYESVDGDLKLAHCDDANCAPNLPPVAQCKNISINACGAVATSIDAGSFDPDSGDTLTLSQSPAGPYGLGAIPVTLTVTDSQGASSSCTATVTVADQTPPSITCPSSRTAAATSSRGALVSFAPSAGDNCGTIIIGCALASGSTFPIGSTAVTCSATDGAGLQNSCGFSVLITYPFTGFFPPVDNPPVVNQVKAGQGIPVKFSLGGNYGLGILASGSPSSQQLPCVGGSAVDDVETVTSRASGLQYDAGTATYTYVWKTDKSWAGHCRQLTVALRDGTMHQATFMFK